LAGVVAGLGSAQAQESPNRGGTLTATWGGGEPQSCYVLSGGGYAPTLTSSKLFERLARRNMDGSFSGMLAERWTPSADFQTYTVTVRPGVRWHDGRELTADDVVFSITELWRKYAIAPAMRDLAGVEATKPDTVVVSFSSRCRRNISRRSSAA
jgi:peptide/nickel transport system substrate-binding protein